MRWESPAALSSDLTQKGEMEEKDVPQITYSYLWRKVSNQRLFTYNV